MSTVQHKTFELESINDGIIRGDVRAPNNLDQKYPVAIVVHGFKGFKNWGFHPYLAEQLALAGNIVVNINFSHNGVGEDLLNFTELDRFKDNRFSFEIDDLNRTIKALGTEAIPFAEFMDTEDITLLGHSRGAIAIFNAALNNSKVKKVIGLATVSNVPPPREDTAKKWREDGVTYIQNMRTKQELPLGIGLLDEMEEGKGSLENVVKNLNQQVLIIHGDKDEVVPFVNAENLASWATYGNLRMIKEADHVFGARHPFQGSTAELKQAIDIIINFLS
ncbi:MAG: hypothetical protein KDD56_03250 [Bdellovibrionales bacterium]|nr:hypothetical protein [Bdellovibrionales bacterium]